MTSMCSQSAPASTMRLASDARFAKSEDSIEGAMMAIPVAELAIVLKRYLLGICVVLGK